MNLATGNKTHISSLVQFQRRGDEKSAVLPLLPLDIAHRRGEGGGPGARRVRARRVQRMRRIVLLGVNPEPRHSIRVYLVSGAAALLGDLYAGRAGGARHTTRLTPEQGLHQLAFHHVHSTDI
jgi:hypothetical protein